MITEEERARALARFRALLSKLPPPSEDLAAEFAAANSSSRLRRIRDRARTIAPGIPASNVEQRSGVSPGDVPRVNSEHPGGNERAVRS